MLFNVTGTVVAVVEAATAGEAEETLHASLRGHGFEVYIPNIYSPEDPTALAPFASEHGTQPHDLTPGCGQ